MYSLIEQPEGLCLINTEAPKELPIRVDFLNASLSYRRKRILHESLTKAIGFKGKPLTVLDTTAGFGQDAFLLACLGCSVTLLERSPILYALLSDGLKRGLDEPELQPIVQRMTLIQEDSLDFMERSSQFDVIYCDPMFPEKTKSALVKKEMRALHSVVGFEDDGAAVVKKALTLCKRVVVKRPRLAPPLVENPSFSHQYTACRFDIYCRAL